MPHTGLIHTVFPLQLFLDALFFVSQMFPWRTRDHDLGECIPKTFASSNDNLFQSNFSAWSNCEAILRKTPDWPI